MSSEEHQNLCSWCIPRDPAELRPCSIPASIPAPEALRSTFPKITSSFQASHMSATLLSAAGFTTVNRLISRVMSLHVSQHAVTPHHGLQAAPAGRHAAASQC